MQLHDIVVVSAGEVSGDDVLRHHVMQAHVRAKLHQDQSDLVNPPKGLQVLQALVVVLLVGIHLLALPIYHHPATCKGADAWQILVTPAPEGHPVMKALGDLLDYPPVSVKRYLQEDLVLVDAHFGLPPHPRRLQDLLEPVAHQLLVLALLHVSAVLDLMGNLVFLALLEYLLPGRLRVLDLVVGIDGSAGAALVLLTGEYYNVGGVLVIDAQLLASRQRRMLQPRAGLTFRLGFVPIHPEGIVHVCGARVV
mmetsp:Transcript_71125/g.212081  ORF Transcript_71125/g.212081 Transcript_71125/m.212081 type:complete len:252 (+) Transcript_71125:1885-2640(+)